MFYGEKLDRIRLFNVSQSRMAGDLLTLLKYLHGEKCLGTQGVLKLVEKDMSR